MTDGILKEMPELAFDEAKHTYRLDGAIIPSVTEIMQPLSAATYSSINPTILKTAAYRGVCVHKAIELFIKDGIENEILPEYGGYYQAFRQWWNYAKPEAIIVEGRVYHPALRYAGTVDLICLIGGKLTLIDFKTSSQIEEKLVRVQMAAYQSAYESHDVTFESKQVVQLKKDGAGLVMELPLVDTDSLTVFGSLININNYLKKK